MNQIFYENGPWISEEKIFFLQSTPVDKGIGESAINKTRLCDFSSIIFRMSDRETSDREGENESGESDNETQPQVE